MQPYILDALRTPVTLSGGKFNSLVVRHLAAPVIRALLERQQISPLKVEQLIMGNALNVGGNPARLVSLQAGLSEMAYATTIDTNNNSGIDAIILGAEKIRAGAADLVIAGGAESVSRQLIKFYRPIEPGELPVKYSQPTYTPWPGANPTMRESAERIAEDGEISELMQQEWVLNSVDKAILAKERLTDEKLSFNSANQSSVTDMEMSEIGQANLGENIEDASKVSEKITEQGHNEAPSADAAAFVIMASERWIEQHRKEASVRLLDTKIIGSAADSPSWAIIDSCRAIMEKNLMSANNFSAIEMAEAHAAQALYCIDELGLDKDIVNMAGGDLARGNPLAAGSAVLLVRLFHELKAREVGDLGLAASAAAGGVGSAVIMQSC